MNEALAEFAKQSDIPLVFSQPDVQALEGNMLVGEYSVSDALQILLDGSGLRGNFVAGGALSVSARRHSSSDKNSNTAEGEVFVKKGLLKTASSVALSIVGTIGAASAQSSGDEIIVEGTRFQNSLSNRLDVPKQELVSTIDEIDQSTLQNLNFINFQEALTTLPGVAFADFNAATGELDLFLRGFEPSFLINNRLIPDLTPGGVGFGATNADQSFIETFEVLKGPASIVFGPVTPGGVINQVYRTPKAEDFTNLTLTGGTFGTYRVEADLNSGKLFGQDWLRGRVTVAYEDVKFAQPQAERQVLAIRPVVEADISDKTALQLSFAYKDSEGVNTSRFPLNEDGSTPTLFTPKTFIGDPTGQTVSENIYAEGELVHNFLDNLKLTLRGAYGDVQTDAGYISGFYAYYADGPDYGISIDPNNYYYDYGYAFAFRNSGNGDLFYGDAQLAGFFDLFGNRQDALLGFTHQSTNVQSFGGSGDAGVVTPSDPSTWVRDPFDYNSIDIFGPNAIFDQIIAKDVLTSVYGEVYLRPLNWLTLPVGVRYDSVEQERTLETVFTTETQDAVTIRAGANAEILPDVNLYYSYAESFIPQSGIQRDGSVLPAETANNHEIGIKSNIIDGMYLTAALYRLERANIETGEPGFFPPDVQTFSVAEGEQVVRGVEVNLTGQVTDQLSLNFAYSYADTEITEPVGLRVGPIDQIPDHTLTVYSIYTFDQGAMSGLRVGGGVRHVGQRFARTFESGSTNPDNSVNLVEADVLVDGYTVLDLIVGYEINDRWDFQVNVQNLTNEEYFVQVGYNRYGGGWKFGEPTNALFTLRATY
ncbi:MAG: TonB-dependent receptor [Pseudomonadota bacterium]